VNLLVRNIRHLVTQDAARARLDGVDLLVLDGRVAAIGTGLSAPDGTGTLDATDHAVFPGLINTHHHMFQVLTRCLPEAQNAPLFDWLVFHYGLWSRLSADAVEASTLAACAELLLTGCTTTSDHLYVFPRAKRQDLMEAQAAAAAASGIRFHMTRGSMSRGRASGGLPPDEAVEDEDEILRDSERVIARFHDPEPLSMLRVGLAPCSPFSISRNLLAETAVLARKHGVRLHTHIAETLEEETYCLAHYGMRPLALLDEAGWLGPDVWLAHGIHFDDMELDLLERTRTGISHCPASNLRLASGRARVPDMLSRGIHVGLGVDGSASNDASDMLGELRHCLLVHRSAGDPSAMTAQRVFDAATLGGARILGRDDVLGRLETGAAADFFGVDLGRLDYAGAQSDPLGAILFCGFSHRVDFTVVGGRVLVRDGRLAFMDEREIASCANAESSRLLTGAP
jgi:cytosine/adenosine deaminase-related metal-dependent hydrolase